jgi:hypothetical protein
VSPLRQEVFQVLRCVTLYRPQDNRASHAHNQANQARASLALGRRGDNALNLRRRRFRGRLSGLANRTALARNQQQTGRKGRSEADPWISPHVITPVSGRFRAGDNPAHVLMQVNTNLRHLVPNLVDLTGSRCHGALPLPLGALVPYFDELRGADSGRCKQRARTWRAGARRNSYRFGA